MRLSLVLALFASYLPAAAQDVDTFEITKVWPPVEVTLGKAPVELHARVRYTLVSMERAAPNHGQRNVVWRLLHNSSK
jgi:hypothetical protein